MGKGFRNFLFSSAIAGILSVLSLANAKAGQVTLGWDAPAETPEGYRVFERTFNGSYNYAQPIWTGEGTSATISNVDKSCFVVRAYDGSDESSNSNEICWDSNLSAYIGKTSSENSWQFVNSEGGSLEKIVNPDNSSYLMVSGNGSYPQLKGPVGAIELQSWECPLIQISAENFGNSEAMDITIEDTSGKQASYYPSQNNFFPGKNNLIIETDFPAVADSGFDSRNIQNVIISGPNNYNLEEIRVFAGGKIISGGFAGGTNASEVYNYSDFNQTYNKDRVKGLASRLTRTKRYVELTNNNLNFSLTPESKLLFMFPLTQDQYNSFPPNAIEVDIGGATYTINKSDLNVGFNEVQVKSITEGNVDHATIRLNHATSLSTTTGFDKVSDFYMGIKQ